MSTTVMGEIAVTERPRVEAARGHRPTVTRRLAGRIGPALWPADRCVAELRWAALNLGLMVALAVFAVVGGDPSAGFGKAVLILTPVLVVVAALAWSPRATRIARDRVLRRLTSPVVVLAVMAAAGPPASETLALPAATPFIILALTYAALTPGFWPAFAIVVVASLAAVLGYLGSDGRVLDAPAIEFIVRAVVVGLVALGIRVIDVGLRRERARSDRLASMRLDQVDQLEGLQRIVARFDGSRSVIEVIQDVVNDVAATFDIALISMYLPDGDGRLSMVGVAGYDHPFHVIQPGVGVIGNVAVTRTTRFVPDVLADPSYRAARADVRSEIAAPILHGDELLGIVNFEGTTDRPLGPGHVAVAEMLARSISGALRSARLDEERRDRLHSIELVMSVSRDIVADLDRQRVVASVVGVVSELLSADTVTLFSRDPDGVYRLEAGAGFPERAIGFPVTGREGMVGRCIDQATRIVGLQEATAWPADYRAVRPGGNEPHAAMAVPILIVDEVTAVLFITRVGADRAFTDLECGIADLLTAQVAIALHNADLHAQVAESAVRDPLTGLLNRRYFDEAVETAFAAAARGATPLSLIVLDLDRFSDVNNQHGHSVGDAVLRRVGRAMLESVRTGDVVVRYGGEEFVIIAPGSGADDAVRLAERVRLAVATEARRPIEGFHVPLTISAGVASRLGDEADGRALFRAADSALLAAKRAGRDRVYSV